MNIDGQSIFPVTFPPSDWQDIQALKDQLPATVAQMLHIVEPGRDAIESISRKRPDIADEIEETIQAWMDVVTANEDDEPEEKVMLLRQQAQGRSADLKKLVEAAVDEIAQSNK